MKPWEEEWRVGSKIGRTVYRVLNPDVDPLIGVMDRAEDAKLAAAAPEMARLLLGLTKDSRLRNGFFVDSYGHSCIAGCGGNLDSMEAPPHADDCPWLAVMRRIGARG